MRLEIDMPSILYQDAKENRNYISLNKLEIAWKAIADGKPLEQEPRKGRWIDKQHLFGYCSAECSSCHKRSNGYVHDNGFSLEYKYYDFCPNCGAKMVEPQESEVDDGNDD